MESFSYFNFPFSDLATDRNLRTASCAKSIAFMYKNSLTDDPMYFPYVRCSTH